MCVMISDPTSGEGIFPENMLSQTDANLKQQKNLTIALLSAPKQCYTETAYCKMAVCRFYTCF